MRYTLLVLSPPDSGPANYHALRFAQTLVARGHELACVFFHDAGVLTALDHAEAPQDEIDLRRAWQGLAIDRATPLFACVASAARHGVHLDEDRSSCGAGFRIGGLGELAEATRSSDRVLTFAD